MHAITHTFYIVSRYFLDFHLHDIFFVCVLLFNIGTEIPLPSLERHPGVLERAYDSEPERPGVGFHFNSFIDLVVNMSNLSLSLNWGFITGVPVSRQKPYQF